jgi:hypothetical protein
MWLPWRGGNSAEQARQRRAKSKPTGKVKGRVTHNAAIAQARKKHRQAALRLLRAGKITPKQYQERLREIG